MQVDKFTTKLNKIDNHIYMIEEEVFISNGVYEGTLDHDNVKTQTINVYTEKKLTGEKLENILLSTPSETPWKTIIKIFAKEGITKAYITYQTTGDTVEADDINFIQDSIVKTQKELNVYAEKVNKALQNAKDYTDTKISDLIGGAGSSYDTLKELESAIKGHEVEYGDLLTVIGRKAEKIYVDSELAKKASSKDIPTKFSQLENDTDIGGLPSKFTWSMLRGS